MRQLAAHCAMLLVTHIYTSRLNSFPLWGTQLGSEKLIEGFLFAILAEPQGLPGLQVADHSDEFHLLAKVDLIHTHLSQRFLAPCK
jgi:hypothetical protein